MTAKPLSTVQGSRQGQVQVWNGGLIGSTSADYDRQTEECLCLSPKWIKLIERVNDGNVQENEVWSFHVYAQICSVKYAVKKMGYVQLVNLLQRFVYMALHGPAWSQPFILESCLSLFL